jgi:hypothetical protein
MVRREEIRTAVLWFGGALLAVTLTGYGVYRAGRKVFGSRSRRSAKRAAVLDARQGRRDGYINDEAGAR